MSMCTALCPCHSGKSFKQCCQPYLSGERYAKTPEKLMRSRFSAFFYGGYGQYLLDTWAPEYAPKVSAIELSQQDTQWLNLEIIEKTQQGDQAIVEFKAAYLDDKQQQHLHHERSQFERRNGRWLYTTGEILNKG